MPDATFSVYGMVGEVPDWDESIQMTHDVVHLGSHDAFDQCRKHPSSEISLKVVRDTVELDNKTVVESRCEDALSFNLNFVRISVG